MLIKNYSELLENAKESDRLLRFLGLELAQVGIESVMPKTAINKTVKFEGSILSVFGIQFDLDDYERVRLIGFGKASHEMADTIKTMLGERLESGVIASIGVGKQISGIRVMPSSHPIPTEKSVEATWAMVEEVRDLGEKDLVICLISGGGSAMSCLPTGEIGLNDKQAVTNLLLKSGATIQEMNVVRKNISDVKGGRLAEHIFPATTICLVISDVIGDDLRYIASGPTVKDDAATGEAAVGILRHYDILEKIPRVVRRHLESGNNHGAPEPEVFDRVHNFLIATNRTAVSEMARYASLLKLKPIILSHRLKGESRVVGKRFARFLVGLKELKGEDIWVVLSAGEPTVRIEGSGKGGRNQEFVLSGIETLIEGTAVISIGTDGIDGASDAAGAVADGSTYTKVKELDLNMEKYLKENDSHHFFQIIEDLIFTGPTGTNVSDIQIGIVL